MIDKTPLEGKAGTPGIEECKLIVEEMSKRLAGSTHGVGGSAPQDGFDCNKGSAGGSAPQEGVAGSVQPVHPNNDECELAIEVACQTDVVDATQDKVQRPVQAELTHVALKQDWESSAVSRKVIVLVD